jgi:hypothetical protein
LEQSGKAYRNQAFFANESTFHIRDSQGETVKTFTTRDWVYIAVFGALWGAIEITLGAYLHVIFPPLADTFLVGVIMAGLGGVIALTGRHFVPYTGSSWVSVRFGGQARDLPLQKPKPASHRAGLSPWPGRWPSVGTFSTSS